MSRFTDNDTRMEMGTVSRHTVSIRNKKPSSMNGGDAEAEACDVRADRTAMSDAKSQTTKIAAYFLTTILCANGTQIWTVNGQWPTSDPCAVVDTSTSDCMKGIAIPKDANSSGTANTITCSQASSWPTISTEQIEREKKQ